MSKKICGKILSFLMCIVTVLSFCAVTSFAAETKNPKLNKTSVKIAVDSSYTLKVSNYSGTVKWSTSNKNIVTVTNKGKIKAKKVGTATVSAVAGKTTLKCKVTVVAGSVKLDQSTYNIASGEAAVVAATIKGSSKVKYQLSDSSAAEVTDMEWNGNKLIFTVAAKKAGTVKFKVFLSDDSSISKTAVIKFKSATKQNSYDEEILEDDYDDDSSDVSNMSYAEQVLYYVNIERANVGAAPLALDDKLCEAADIRAKEIVDNFSHTRPDGTSCFTVIGEVGLSKGTCAENIAAGNSTAEATVEQWMNSSGHRANILSTDYSLLGVGMAYDRSSTYRWYWVQLFSD